MVDLGRANYFMRDGVDDGFYYDRNGSTRDLPEDYRIVSRMLNGKIMLVTKGSIWNGAPSTYSGTHDRHSASEIRAAIERAIVSRDAA